MHYNSLTFGLLIQISNCKLNKAGTFYLELKGRKLNGGHSTTRARQKKSKHIASDKKLRLHHASYKENFLNAKTKESAVCTEHVKC